MFSWDSFLRHCVSRQISWDEFGQQPEQCFEGAARTSFVWSNFIILQILVGKFLWLFSLKQYAIMSFPKLSAATTLKLSLHKTDCYKFVYWIGVAHARAYLPTIKHFRWRKLYNQFDEQTCYERNIMLNKHFNKLISGLMLYLRASENHHCDWLLCKKINMNRLLYLN